MDYSPAHQPVAGQDVLVIRGLSALAPNGDDAWREPHHVDLHILCNGHKWRVCLLEPRADESILMIYAQRAEGEVRAPDSGDICSGDLPHAVLFSLSIIMQYSGVFPGLSCDWGVEQ